jgi:hypothetical protein
MKADKLTVNGLFDPNERRDAPLFQRPYVWGEESNWEPLWESIRDLATKRLTHNEVRPHFLGTVVLDQLLTSAGKLHVRQLIDGQQRLTTLQLALAAARDLCAERGENKYRESFKGLTDNHVPLSDDPDDLFKVWPTNADREEFRLVMKAGARTNVEQLLIGGESRIKNAYLYFFKWFAAWIDENTSQPQERLRALHSALRDDLTVVVIDLERDDDAQEIFETLNALGTPLLPADLVKNYLFRRAEAQHLDTQKLYAQYWKGFDDDKAYWRKEKRQGRLKRPMLDLFLNHFLALSNGREANATQMFSEFKELVESDAARTPQDHLRTFHEYAQVYESFERFQGGSREGTFFERLNEMDTSTVFPLLLEIFKNTAKPEMLNERQQVLVDIESFLVRRLICGLTTKSYNRFFAQMAGDLKKAGDGFSAANIRSRLLSETAESTEWPSDATFQSNWETIDFYKRIRKPVQRMILEALEQALHQGKTEKIRIEKKLTVEHLLPREWEANWPLIVREGSAEAQMKAKEQRENSIHRIGNLSLLTRELNPSVSNGPWARKRDKILEHSALNLNRPFKDAPIWDESMIERRSRTLFEIAKNIWPHP